MTVPAITVPAAQAAVTGAVMCAISLTASASTSKNADNQFNLATPALQIKLPKVPKLSLPKLPDLNIDLPNFGKKKDVPSAPKAAPIPRPLSGKVRVRASSAVSASNPDAPSAADVTGIPVIGGIKATGEWKRFPSKRMPGANMDGFKDMAKGMKIGPEMK